MQKQFQIMDQKAADHDYLHKDFHGALSYAILYLDKTFGLQATIEYLQQVGRTCYAPLSAQIKKLGLSALEKHLRHVFTKEEGRFTIHYEGNTLVLEIQQCPAVSHLRKTGQLFTERFCESTKVINETICQNAGYRSSCIYEPGQGKCVQKFWQEAKA